MTDQAIAIDLGGTKTSWALIDSSYRATDHQEIFTPNSLPEIIAALEKIITETAAAAPNVTGIGIGVAGLVDHHSGTVMVAPNLPMNGVPLAKILKDTTTLDCMIDNDANLAALGELYSGAGRGRRSYIGLTVGTGVGGGIVIDGKLWRGANSSAGEFGHMVVAADGIPCGCGNRGCLEQMASGTALTRMGRELVAAEPDSRLGRIFSGDPDRVTGKAISAAARDGNTQALAIFAELGRWLGVGVSNLINIFNPEIVILGGGVASALDLVIESVSEELHRAVVDPRAKETPLLISQLDNNAGLIGAAGLILDR